MEGSGKQVFSLYSQLRLRGVPVFLELWSGIDGVEYFTLSHHPSMPPPPPPVSKRRRRRRRRRRTTPAPPVEPSNRSDALVAPSRGRGSCERPPGEVETPQRHPEELRTSPLSLGEVSKAQRHQGMVETSRCSLEEVEAETPPSPETPSSPETPPSPETPAETPPCSRHVPWTVHIPLSPSDIPQLDGAATDPELSCDPDPVRDLGSEEHASEEEPEQVFNISLCGFWSKPICTHQLCNTFRSWDTDPVPPRFETLKICKNRRDWRPCPKHFHTRSENCFIYDQ